MAEDATATLAPPAVSNLRAQAGQMERSLSLDIREEREDLREAAEQTLNVIMDLSLDGIIRWVSPSWVEVVGTPMDSVQGKPIADILLDDNKAIFADTVESMKQNDERSHMVRFTVQLGPASRLARSPRYEPEGSPEEQMDLDYEEETLELEAQGIMVYTRSSDGESHTMWMIRPFIAPREIKIDLPSIIADSLGSGAEVLASYLTTLAESGLEDPENHAPPLPVLCRICERQIPPWWFEKHTELCLQEHKAEMEVQMAQDNLTEHRHAIVKVLDALEARKVRPLSGELAGKQSQAEYKGMPIGPAASPSSSSSGTASPGSPLRSREPSTSGLGHARGRSFAVRRPQARIVELLLDLCDTALEINTPAIKESNSASGDFRTQSPQSENRISQVVQWQSPSTNTLEQEQGLALLCADSEEAAKNKVEAVIRHRRIIEYAERIRMEFAVIVQDCIDGAIRKAKQIAAGNLSDSTEGEESNLAPEEPFFAGSFEAPSSLPRAMRDAGSEFPGERRASSVAVSTGSGSNSPKECPTPRSNVAASILGPAPDSRCQSLYFDSENGDSDGSARSSSLANRPPRTVSPVSEFGDLRRAASSRQRQRQRRSLILTGTISPKRQSSPSRMAQPSSPLHIQKPRALPISHEGVRSPIGSPLLPSQSDFGSPALVPHHHRRQSSAAGSDALKPPPSPRLSSVSAPQARAVQPSIKDFEIIKPISKGAFGSVYLVKKKSTGDYYAIKVLKKADMVAKNQVTNVKAERAIMMWQGESDFVAKLYWTFSSKDYLYLVMEYLNGGDCASLIKILGGLSEDWAKKYLGEVILGVEHLHSRGIVHRDLKPDNLLIDQKGHLKLTDFGLSRMGVIGRQKRVQNSSAMESAPDLLKHGPFGRSTSITSSRSASFDFQGHHSPGSTPQMTPDLAGSISYFNLTRNEQLPREQSRRASGHRSDSGGSDSLTAMFGSLSVNDSPHVLNQRRSPIEEMNESEGNASPDIISLHPTYSHQSNSDIQHKNTPPQTSMMPPPMALFDPDDSNRRFVGTPDYLAPETVKGLGQDETSDWWSVGCILFEFLFGYPPFHDETPDQVFENILARRISWPDENEVEVSPEARDLIEKFLCMDPSERIGANKDDKYASGAEEIRNHPWFADMNWQSLLEDEAQFVPAPENPEDTEYFDSRGATLQAFAEEMEDQLSPAVMTPGADYPERPHDALSRVRTQVNSLKRNLMPLHIPPHVRDANRRRLSEPVAADDFGSFSFKNLPVLEKANKDVIQKLRAEAMAAQSKVPAQAVSTPSSAASTTTSPAPILEGSPVIPMPVQRTISNAKASARPQSPSGFSQANSSPSRSSQPSSPLLVSFHAGQNTEARRKTSSNSSSLSHQSSTSLPPGSFFEIPRMPASLQKSTITAAPSPLKTKGAAVPAAPVAMSPGKMVTPRQSSGSSTRARSQTVGSQDGGSPAAADLFHHKKRRSQVFDMSPSSSDNEGDKANALLRVQRRRQSSRRLSQINLADGPAFRPLDVLICEDHPVSRMVMEKLMEKLRCRTITVSNGVEAMRYAMSDIKFDLIMMEFKLPQINGADVARMIRDTTKHANAQTPIVAITGYLKELQAPHYFDALIEKPPTTSKLTEVMCQLCQWKAPPQNQCSMPPPAYPLPSGLRQESVKLEDSPTSGSSGYANPMGSSFRGSSREDSISSSLFGDSESAVTDDIPVVIGRQATNEWQEAGLGITNEDAVMVDRMVLNKSTPAQLLHRQSAPTPMVVRRRSSEQIKAKRESLEKHRHECAESGDDEDEELGDVHVREKSPKHAGKPHRGSKLGTEMMRTNSHGSIVSNSSQTSGGDPIVEIVPPEAVGEEQPPAFEITGASLTPPEIFQTPSGKELTTVDLLETPKAPIQSSRSSPDSLGEPTPRAPSSSTNSPGDYLSVSKSHR